MKELKAHLARFKHVHECARIRKARQEALMSRKGAKKWDAATKSRAVRRLMTANQLLEQATEAINQIIDLIATESAQIAPKPANNVAPFVPAPATSV
jgi:hypothetical protein